jgi:hypothetical protein
MSHNTIQLKRLRWVGIAGFTLMLGHGFTFGADRPSPLVDLPSEQVIAKIGELQQKVKADSNDLVKVRELGILLHIHNEEKRIPAEVEAGIRLLKKITKADAKDYEAKAWLGSLITMQAEYETNPGKRTFYVKLGSREMDAAIKALPDDIPIRLIRGYNSLTLPPFLERNRFAIEDFQFILDFCKKSTCQEKRMGEASKGLEKAKART